MKETIRVSEQRKIELSTTGGTITLDHAPKIVLNLESAEAFEYALTRAIEHLPEPEHVEGNHHPVTVSRVPRRNQVKLEVPHRRYVLTGAQADELQAEICQILETMTKEYSPVERYR